MLEELVSHSVALVLGGLFLLPTVSIAGSVLTPPVTVSGASSGPIFFANNDASGPAVMGKSARGVGVYAISRSSSAPALRAANYNASAGSAIDASATGNAIVAGSQAGSGIVGSTRQASGNTTAGVRGFDLSISSPLNAGVRGTSRIGTGVMASSENGFALIAQTGSSIPPPQPGFYSVAAKIENLSNRELSVGLQVTTRQGTAISATNLGHGIGISASATKDLPAFYGFSGNAGPTFLGEMCDAECNPRSTVMTNVMASGPSGSQYYEAYFGRGDIAVEADGEDSTAPALWAYSTRGGPAFIASTQVNGSPSDIFSISTTGDVIALGTITAMGTPQTFIKTASGRTLVGYSARQSQPSMEDFGEGVIRNGQGVVAIDPQFADTIDHSTNYLVFITAEGDNRGLYVTQKSTKGFIVRESQGGHSSLAFSYRIVAKPQDAPAQRLPDAMSVPGYRLFGTTMRRVRHRAVYIPARMRPGYAEPRIR